MQESLNILLIEDNKAISDAYRVLLEAEGNEVVCAYDADEAITILEAQPSIAFDLFFTDIDLVGDPTKGADRSGIAFACYARKTLPNIAVVGHSAYFDNDDISPEERDCFDEWFPKGIKTAEREKMFEQTLTLARRKRKERVASAPANLSSSDFLAAPTSDQDFVRLGCEKDTVTPNAHECFKKPFAVWRRETSEGCELEVVGYPALLAWGEGKTEAYEHLFNFIDSNRDLATLPNEQLSSSTLQIANFVRDVCCEGATD